MRSGRAGGGLPALRERLVGDTAGADHRDLGVPLTTLGVTVTKQGLADLVHVGVRDLAAEEVDAERRHALMLDQVLRCTSAAQPSTAARSTCSYPGSRGSSDMRYPEVTSTSALVRPGSASTAGSEMLATTVPADGS